MAVEDTGHMLLTIAGDHETHEPDTWFESAALQ
jgi:hypothetical protein